MLNDDESTPPISPFGAQRAIARELAGMNQALERMSRELANGRKTLALLFTLSVCTWAACILTLILRK